MQMWAYHLPTWSSSVAPYPLRIKSTPWLPPLPSSAYKTHIHLPRLPFAGLLWHPLLLCLPFIYFVQRLFFWASPLCQTLHSREQKRKVRALKGQAGNWRKQPHEYWITHSGECYKGIHLSVSREEWQEEAWFIGPKRWHLNGDLPNEGPVGWRVRGKAF